MKKRILAIILTFAMVLTLVPVFAVTSSADEIDWAYSRPNLTLDFTSSSGTFAQTIAAMSNSYGKLVQTYVLDGDVVRLTATEDSAAGSTTYMGFFREYAQKADLSKNYGYAAGTWGKNNEGTAGAFRGSSAAETINGTVYNGHQYVTFRFRVLGQYDEGTETYVGSSNTVYACVTLQSNNNSNCIRNPSNLGGQGTVAAGDTSWHKVTVQKTFSVNVNWRNCVGYFFRGFNTGDVIEVDYVTWGTSQARAAAYQSASELEDYAQIQFDANGGSGAMDTIYAAPASTVELPVCTLAAPAGTAFAGWNTAADGTGTAYAAGAEITAPAAGSANAVVLYAQWASATTYTLSYNINGGNGELEIADVEMAEGAVSVVAEALTSSYASEGMRFKNWNTASDGTGTTYAPGSNFTMGTEDTVLYAIWEPIPAKVVYDFNYAVPGNVSTTVPADANEYWIGDTVTVLGAPTASGGSSFVGFYNFTGWNTAADGSGTMYQPDDTFTVAENNQIITLYAIWVKSNVTYKYINLAGTVSYGNMTVPVNTVITIGNNNSAVTNATTFIGWNTVSQAAHDDPENPVADGTWYYPGQTFNVGTQDHSFYARQGATYAAKVVYNLNGLTGVTAPVDYQIYCPEHNAEVATVLNYIGEVAAEYQFIGWNTTADGTGTAYAVGDTIDFTGTENGETTVTLYAIWQEVTVDPVAITLADGSALLLDAENHFVTNVTVGMTVAQFLAEFDGEYTVYDADNNVIADTTTVVATGMVIALVVNDEVVDSYTVVIYGDIDGDGNINVNDIVALRAHINAGTLSGAFLEAANTDRDTEGNVNVNDIVAVRSDINGTPINQGAVEAE